MRKFLQLFLLFAVTNASAQKGKKYAFWVEFNTKDTAQQILSKPELLFTEKCIDRRYKHKIPFDYFDIPVSRLHTEKITAKGYEILSQSRWLNAVTIKSSYKEVADSLKGWKFIKQVVYLGELDIKDSVARQRDLSEMISMLEAKFDDIKKKKKDTLWYGKASAQNLMLNIQSLHQKGYDGTGIDVAVIDAGFKNARFLPHFKHLFDSARMLGTWDFVSGEENVFDDDDHGLSVFSCIGASKPYEYVGTAPQANYWLLRTEQAATEQLLEEALWVQAVEFADSVGADIVNSSLGYNLFDDKSMNHKQKELNGQTAIISRAASIASSRGLLIVSSAGNEGDNKWRQIGFPADANGILTVGSVDQKLNHSLFSSIGPSADKRIKPDVVAMGENTYVVSGSGTVHQGNGTSYSSPIMAGVAACLLQANITVTPDLIIKALQLSAHQYFSPDKFEGYGLPDAALADTILKAMTAIQWGDQCLDARWLKDKNLHMVVYVKQPQKVKMMVSDEFGKYAYEVVEKIKSPGVYRFPLKKTAKLPDGVYEIKVLFAGGVNSFKIIKSK